MRLIFSLVSLLFTGLLLADSAPGELLKNTTLSVGDDGKPFSWLCVNGKPALEDNFFVMKHNENKRAAIRQTVTSIKPGKYFFTASVKGNIIWALFSFHAHDAKQQRIEVVSAYLDKSHLAQEDDGWITISAMLTLPEGTNSGYMYLETGATAADIPVAYRELSGLPQDE
jgi:hypothetical protein